MARTISLGAQGFEDIRANGYFYVDKTAFISNWWLSGDVVTLICRPRRFGKTLNLDTVRCFLSTEFAGRGAELFGGLAVWENPTMRELQGSVPVVSLSFAAVKERDFGSSLRAMKRILRVAVGAHGYLRESSALGPGDLAFLGSVTDDMSNDVAVSCLGELCRMLEAHHGVKPVVLLDEYDAPMQEAWLGGFWDEAVAFQRALFNATFKTNPALGRGLMTGVTRVSRESIFSDLNNLVIDTVLDTHYPDALGFTEGEVMAALEEYGMVGHADDVRHWYDGFTFDGVAHIYNPWSLTKYLDSGKLLPHWANTSGNGLTSSIVRTGGPRLKAAFERLLAGGSVAQVVDDQVVFSQLGRDEGAVWSLLVAAGYLRVDADDIVDGHHVCELSLTNREVRVTFDDMIARWFADAGESYGDFCDALLTDDVRGMTRHLSDIAVACMSSFDTGRHASGHAQPERFWHGLVLGLLVRLRGRYAVESNRESGYGRCDVLLTPIDPARDDGIVLEFKVVDAYGGERTLEDAVAAACAQVEGRAYAAALVERGVQRVRSYGIAFYGKEVLIGRS